MKVLKTLGLVVLGLLAIVALLGLIAPNQVVISRSTTINAAPATVYQVVSELPSWERWSPWQRRDATIKNEYSETTAGAGAYYTWTSEDSGAGQLTITDAWGPDSLHTLIEFDGQGNTNSNWYFKPADKGTEVTWTFDSKFPFPFNAMLLFQDFEGMISKDYEEGLAFLKEEVESILPAGPDLTIQEVDFPATHYLVKRATVAMKDMGAHFQEVMPAVGMAFGESGVAMAGTPTGLFYTWDEETQTSDVAIGIPAASGAAIEGLTSIDIPAGRALQINYVGPYEGTGAAHEALDAYMVANGLKFQAPAIEKYMGDPGPDTETDPNKWMTQIVYLLEE
ncbi:MAG: SRPBCC family protein [Lewinella sp.]|jgi:effector-binding domain-containing protein|uniref:SRPBCC family protein n=1 Tax=Lewinella sp. TaxID=2004506 RepID=UPI003D6BC7D7